MVGIIFIRRRKLILILILIIIVVVLIIIMIQGFILKDMLLDPIGLDLDLRSGSGLVLGLGLQ